MLRLIWWCAGALVLAGCESTRGGTSTAGATAPQATRAEQQQTRIIPIYNFKYADGNPVRVHVGEFVQWVNADSMVHSATGDEFDTGFIQPGEKSEPIQFLQATPADGMKYGCLVHDSMSGRLIVEAAPAPALHVGPSVHSMVVLGSDPEHLVLHHISLFNDPHHYYHVTLEATLLDEPARVAYRKAVAGGPHANRPIIFDPDPFILTELQDGTRREMTGALSQATVAPLVNFGDPIPGLERVRIAVGRLLQFRKYDPAQPYPDRLHYQLVAAGSDLFLLHEVGGAPSFQEAARVDITPALSTHQLQAAPIVVIPNKRLQHTSPVQLNAAMLNNSTHILFSPPPRTLRPEPPLGADETLDAEIGGTPYKIKVVAPIYFDTRILNK